MNRHTILGFLGDGEKLPQDKASTLCRWLSGWRKTWLVHYFPIMTSVNIQPVLIRGWGKTGPAHSFPILTSESINLVQKLGYLGEEKLGQPILSPPRLVKVSTLPCDEYANLCFLGVGKNWASPFFPHPDKIKHQPCADGYLGGEKLGWPIKFPTLTSESINLTLSWINIQSLRCDDLLKSPESPLKSPQILYFVVVSATLSLVQLI